MDNHQRKNIISIVAVLLFLVLSTLFGSVVSFVTSTLGIHSSFESVATSIVRECAKTNYPPSCYDEEIPKLMDRGFSMEDAFHVTAIVQSMDSNYFYCHVLGHNLSAKEAAKDLSKWTEVVARAPSGICSNGAIHGAFQERFRDEVLSKEQLEELMPQLVGICQDSENKIFTGLEKASCHHAIGHLSMYMTGANINASTGVCDRVSEELGEDYTQTCYEGAYMQIFQPLEPEDFALIRDIEPQNQDEAYIFCERFTGKRRSACHRESWPHYREAITTDAGALQEFCNFVPDSESVKICYNAMFYVIAAQLNFDERKIISICESLPEERMGQCFANSASRFIETDYRLSEKAAHLCAVAESYGVGERCYNELLFYSTFNFLEGSDAFITMCDTLPESWKNRCLNGDGKNIQPSIND